MSDAQLDQELPALALSGRLDDAVTLFDRLQRARDGRVRAWS